MLRKVSNRVCPLCAKSAVIAIARQKYALPDDFPLSREFDVVMCDVCGFAFADTASSEGDFNSYYSDYSKYSSVSISTGAGTSPPDRERIARQASRIAAFAPDKSTLIADIGCGAGGLLFALKELGFSNLIGCDASGDCVDYIKSCGFEGARYLLGEPFDMNIQPDVVVLSHVLEHLLNPGKALAALNSALPLGGKIYAEVPDAATFSKDPSSFGYEFNLEHINYYSKATLSSLLEASGFVVTASGRDELRMQSSLCPVVYSVAEKKSDSVNDRDNDFIPDLELKQSLIEYAEKSALYINTLRDNLLKFTNSGRVILWGAGVILNKLLAYDDVDSTRIACIIDGNESIQGLRINGVPIVSSQCVMQNVHDFEGMPVIISSRRAADSIRKAARSMDFKLPLFTLDEPGM